MQPTQPRFARPGGVHNKKTLTAAFLMNELELIIHRTLVQTKESPQWLSGKICPREFQRENISDNHGGLSNIKQTRAKSGAALETARFSDFWIKTVREYEAKSCPRLNSEHIPVNLRVSLTVLNPDFTGVIQKSEPSSASAICNLYDAKKAPIEMHTCLTSLKRLPPSP